MVPLICATSGTSRITGDVLGPPCRLVTSAIVNVPFSWCVRWPYVSKIPNEAGDTRRSANAPVKGPPDALDPHACDQKVAALDRNPGLPEPGRLTPVIVPQALNPAPKEALRKFVMAVLVVNIDGTSKLQLTVLDGPNPPMPLKSCDRL